MKRCLGILLATMMFMAPTAGLAQEADTRLYIRVGDAVLTARLADNSSAQALADLLRAGDIVIDAHDYGHFEKVGALPSSLPRNDEPLVTQAGDLILYQGDQFVLYYDTNAWTFTRLGWIEDVTREELTALLGEGDVQITLSLTNTTKPVVCMPPDISSAGLMAVYEALGRHSHRVRS